MGVLQRFSISYFVCAFIELYYFKANNYSYSASELILPTNKIKFNFMEILLYPIQWLIVAFLVLVWLLVTFLLPVDGCPTGYLGPGGLNANGQYFNCTGGAAGFIDRIVLGANHIYADPTCKEIYQTTIPYDPEGLLGCLTSCVLCYIGVSIGHVIVHYKEVSKRIWKFLAYAIFYGSISLILTKCSLNDGWIPINKNLWSLSFIFSIASIALIALVILYFLIDIYDVYSGTPFLYLGRNSITIYICHILFREYFPFFKVDNKHSYLLALHLYGVAIWCLVAAIMNKKKVYINL
jgi:heparan-alpha-glucosaminide N-acetyltransferase